MTYPTTAVGRLCAVALLLMSLLGRAHAAGPILVNGAGEPLKWTVSAIPFNPDRGTLGQLGNATAISHVATDFAVWSAVSTATVRFVNAGPLPVDVNVTNYQSFLGVCDDGFSPIIFDTDGTITDDLFGAGASNTVLGFSSPDCGTFVPPVITEGSSVLNGKFIDGINTPSNPEISVADFDAVFTHEFGHYAGLDHSQIGLQEAFDGDSTNDDAVATMFPYIVDPAKQAVLNLDDRVAISVLYPASSFASAFGTITGSIFLSDGVTPFQGAYVIARRVDDPRVTAVGVASGARFFPNNFGGPPLPALQGQYEIPGLPPASYTVEIEAIDPLFTDGSSVGPLDPPAELPGPPEFWNGGNESSANDIDNPTEAMPLALIAGTTQQNINVIINGTTCSSSVDVTNPNIVISKLDTSAADDKLTLSGLMTLPYPIDPPLDPLTNGVRFNINDAAGSVLDVTIPGGAFDSVRAKGWKVNRTSTKWTYVDKTSTPLNGIVQTVVQDQSRLAAGRVKFSAKGKGGSYGVSETDLPLTGQVILNAQGATTAQCGRAVFPGAPAPHCRFNAAGSKLTCK